MGKIDEKLGNPKRELKSIKQNQVRTVKTSSKITNSLDEFISRMDIAQVA